MMGKINKKSLTGVTQKPKYFAEKKLIFLWTPSPKFGKGRRGDLKEVLQKSTESVLATDEVGETKFENSRAENSGNVDRIPNFEKTRIADGFEKSKAALDKMLTTQKEKVAQMTHFQLAALERKITSVSRYDTDSAFESSEIKAVAQFISNQEIA